MTLRSAVPEPLSRNTNLPNPHPALPVLCLHFQGKRGSCPAGSCDLLYLLISFLFPEPEYPPQVTEICSAKGFYGKLQMTPENAKSRFIFKPRALSTLSIHPLVASLRWEHLLML